MLPRKFFKYITVIYIMQCQMRSAPAANRTHHVGFVTCVRYRYDPTVNKTPVCRSLSSWGLEFYSYTGHTKDFKCIRSFPPGARH